jgi:hypothetical protein
MTQAKQRLLDIQSQLDDDNRDSLLSFAEFLLSRQPPAQRPVPIAPLDIPRPADETVVAAIRRLRDTYPMVPRARVFDKSSALMSEHILAGREVTEVIDELDALFAQEYQSLTEPDDRGEDS